MIALSETRVWRSVDTILSTNMAATGAPETNLKHPDLGKFYRDTSAATNQGFYWNYNGDEVDAWALAVAALNDAGAAAGRDFLIRLDDVSPYSGSSTIADTGNDTYSPVSKYAIVGTPDMERVDHMIAFGVDTLNSGGPPVTGVPTAFAHKSGLARWAHGGGSHQDGYHQAAGFFVGVNPLVFPAASELDVKSIELRRSSGWEVTIGWQFLPERAFTDGGQSYSGGVDLANLVSAQRRRPIMALLDTSGCDGTGIPTSPEAAPWMRLGVARIVSQDRPAAFFGPAGLNNVNFTRNLTVRTWEDAPAGDLPP